jgi:hypothetical protein
VPWASSGRAPERSKLPQTSAPTALMAAAHQKAVVYPSTAAWCSNSRRDTEGVPRRAGGGWAGVQLRAACKVRSAAPRGRPVAVVGFTVAHGRIVEIDLLADPARLRELDLTALDD